MGLVYMHFVHCCQSEVYSVFLFVFSLCFSSLTLTFFFLITFAYTLEAYFKSSLEANVIINKQQQQKNLIKSEYNVNLSAIEVKNTDSNTRRNTHRYKHRCPISQNLLKECFSALYVDFDIRSLSSEG